MLDRCFYNLNVFCEAYQLIYNQ